MQTIFNALEGWLWKTILNLIFGFFNGMFSVITYVYNFIFPIIADILRINPFGTTTFTYSATGATVDLSGLASFIEGASQTLQFIGVELALLLGLYGMLKASASLIELKRAEHIFVHFLKFGIVIWAITNIYSVIETLFNIFIGVNDLLIDYGSGSMVPSWTMDLGISSAATDLQNILSGIDSVEKVAGAGQFVLRTGTTGASAVYLTAANFPTLILILLIFVIIVIVSIFGIVGSVIDICKEMIARLVRFYLHLVLCPLVLPFGLTEGTKQSLRSYFTSLAGVALEWVLSIELVLIIGKMLAVIPPAIQGLFTSIIDSISSGVFGSDTEYIGIISALAAPVVVCSVYSLILNIMKSLMGKLDTIAKGMLSLGGI